MRTPFLILSIFTLLFLLGCESDDRSTDWKVSPTFKAGDVTLYGNEGRFGMIKMSGNNDEFFVEGKGGLYHIYFWGETQKLHGKYKLVATHKETEDEVILYEWPIQTGKNDANADAHSGGKFGLKKSGLWRLDVFVNEVHFDSMVVDVKDNGK
jgi:hypothetical protein